MDWRSPDDPGRIARYVAQTTRHPTHLIRQRSRPRFVCSRVPSTHHAYARDAGSATAGTLADEAFRTRRNLRKSGGVAAVGRETALLALGGGRFWGEAERDDGRAS